MIQLKNFNCTIRCQEQYYTPQMQALLSDIESAFKAPLQVLKDDPTSTVILVEIDGHWRVIKRTNTRHWTQVLRRWFSRSRAQKNWENAQLLRERGIHTFEPIAYVEKRWGPFKGRSYFVSSYVPGTVAVAFFLEDSYSPQWQIAAENITIMINSLAEHRISHRDLNLSNIILVDQQPWLIDLDSMRCHWLSLMAKRAANREWIRFQENWQDVLSFAPKSQAFYREFKKKYMPG